MALDLPVGVEQQVLAGDGDANLLLHRVDERLATHVYRVRAEILDGRFRALFCPRGYTAEGTALFDGHDGRVCYPTAHTAPQ